MADGLNAEVYRISSGANGIFDGVPPQGDDLVTSFDTASLGIGDPEGIEYDPDSGHLYIVGQPTNTLAQVSTEGNRVRTIDISTAGAVKPAGLAYAPSSANSLEMNIFIADRGIDNGDDPNENDGRIYEVSIPQLTPGNLPLVGLAGADQTITLPASAVLDGTVDDDGTPGPTTTAWSQIAGPGTATFADFAAVDTIADFSAPGTYTLRLSADDGELSSFADTLVIVQGAGNEIVTETRVSSGSDDAEERATGGVRLSSSDLELVYDSGGDQTVGMRFNGVGIPQGSAILQAHIQFQVDEAKTVPTSLAIQGEAVDDSQAFLSSDGNVTLRPRTSTSTSWEPPGWTTVGEAGPDQRTPNIAPVIQEIVSRAGWAEGNSLTIIISGTGERVAESYNGVKNAAPLLQVEYVTDQPNVAPSVTIVSPVSGSAFPAGSAVSFTGTASDSEDGDLTSSLSWVSSRDGTIGSGGTFSRSDLSEGVHTITTSVLDSGGLSDSAQVTVTIQAANVPVTLSFAPSDDTRVDSKRNNKNYGNSTFLRLRANKHENYLKFAVNGLGSSVQSAKLRLFVNDHSPSPKISVSASGALD